MGVKGGRFVRGLKAVLKSLYAHIQKKKTGKGTKKTVREPVEKTSKSSEEEGMM